MKAKRLAALLLTLALTLALTACNGSEPQTPQPPQDSGGESQTGESGGANAYGYDLSGVSPITIVMTSALNNTHCCYAGFYEPFMALVTEMSDGLITWETYLGGELVEGGKEYDALRDGVADVAMP